MCSKPLHGRQGRRHALQLALLEFKNFQGRHGFHLLLPLPFLPAHHSSKTQLLQPGKHSRIVAMMVGL
uniref:Uncharacterized protein n=1 Tax=Arundo donax TaxID=35708 RepID=A0A0A9AKV9_ARUDO